MATTTKNVKSAFDFRADYIVKFKIKKNKISVKNKVMKINYKKLIVTYFKWLEIKILKN